MALQRAIDEGPFVIGPQIVTGEANKVVHMEWDNHNNIVSNIHGSNIANSTGGIIIQEV